MLTMCLFCNPVKSIAELMFSVAPVGISTVEQDEDLIMVMKLGASSLPEPCVETVQVEAA